RTPGHHQGQGRLYAIEARPDAGTGATHSGSSRQGTGWRGCQAAGRSRQAASTPAGSSGGAERGGGGQTSGSERLVGADQERPLTRGGGAAAASAGAAGAHAAREPRAR